MYHLIKSSLSFKVFGCIFFASLCGQQKSNDFTKRLFKIDGKLSSYSHRKFSSSSMSALSNRRIKLEDWPSKYSSFGGKRFPVGTEGNSIQKTFDYEKVNFSRPLNGEFSSHNFERVELSPSQTSNAVSAVKFRDAYYAELDKRVDDWMQKVNNLSLRDINRFQFREGRPSEPGFPVQRAGSALDLPKPKSNKSLDSKTKINRTRNNALNNGYWLGPKKVSTNESVQKITDTPKAESSSAKKNFKSSPKPLFGPKSIRVQVK